MNSSGTFMDKETRELQLQIQDLFDQWDALLYDNRPWKFTFAWPLLGIALVLMILGIFLSPWISDVSTGCSVFAIFLILRIHLRSRKAYGLMDSIHDRIKLITEEIARRGILGIS